jgi:ABC-type transport system involved in multi-copper enzyme maturation permease subunit
MTATQQTSASKPSWFTRFSSIVRYEMLWNIRKKKFLFVLIIAFVIATIVLLVPILASNATGVAIKANANYAISFGGTGFIYLLFAIGTAMNSISSEFESGTIVPLVTKPVSRTMIFLGKLFSAFMIILVSYTVLYSYVTVASIALYGAQNSLQYMPLIVVGTVMSTFIWVALLFAVGALTKNTIITVIVAIILFIALFFAIPIVGEFSGPSQTLNYFPGNGATGTLIIQQNISSIGVGAGTDNVGSNLVNFALYPNANVNFYKINITSVTVGATSLPISSLVYTEPTSTVAARSIEVASAYIMVFLFIAWLALKRSQVMD